MKLRAARRVVARLETEFRNRMNQQIAAEK
jgi:hypothetical protein